MQAGEPRVEGRGVAPLGRDEEGAPSQASSTACRAHDSPIAGTERRSHCSAAARAMPSRRWVLVRSATQRRVTTGWMRVAPSSVAFSTAQSMASRLSAEISRRSSGSGEGARSSAPGPRRSTVPM